MTDKPYKKISSLCAEVQEDLSAVFDGEDQLLEQTDIERHLDGCPECTAYQSELHALHNQLQKELSPSCDANELWARIQESIRRDEALKTLYSVKQVAHKRANRLMGFALAASVMVAVFFAGSFFDSSSNESLELIAETVRDFETFQIRGELLDVDTTKMSNVVQWMSAKVDFELPDSTITPPIGFTIHGGRLCSLLNRRSAFFYYEKESDMLSLYVMKADGLSISHDDRYKTSTTQAGLTTVSWARDDLAYVIVSDLPADEVVKFASRS